jgi:hypothetical protein
VFDKCPRCDYPLTGLPEEHACPECGLRYDQNSRIYRQRGDAVYGLLGGLMGGGWGFFQMLHAYRVSSGWERLLLFLVLCALMISLAWLAHYIYRQKRGRYIAAVADGVLLGHYRLRPRLIPWSNISRVERMRAISGAVLFIRDKRTTIDVAGVFRSPVDADEFAVVSNAYISRGVGQRSGVTAFSELPAPEALAELRQRYELGKTAETLPLQPFRKRTERPFVLLILCCLISALVFYQLRLFWMTVICFAGVAVVMVASIFWLFTGERIPQELRIMERGLCFLRGNELLFSCRWEDFARIRYYPMLGRFIIEHKDRRVLFDVSARQIGKPSFAKSMIKRIMQAKFRHPAPLKTNYENHKHHPNSQRV